MVVKRRLRKQLRLGEFRELGFEVSFRLPADFDEATLDAFWDSFIAEAIEAHDLSCGGGCGQEWDVFVVRGGRRSATDADRQAVAAWLAEHPGVLNVRIGPLVDAWHST